MLCNILLLGLAIYEPDKVDHTGQPTFDDPPGEGTPQSRKPIGGATGSPLTENSPTVPASVGREEMIASFDNPLESSQNPVARAANDLIDSCNGFVRHYYMREQDLDVGACRKCSWPDQSKDHKYFTCMPSNTPINCTLSSEAEFFAASSYGMVCKDGDHQCNTCCDKHGFASALEIEYSSNATCCKTDEPARMPTFDGQLPTCTEPTESSGSEIEEMLDLCNSPAVAPFFKRKTSAAVGNCRKCPGMANLPAADKFFKCLPKSQDQVHCRQNITTQAEWEAAPWYGVKCKGTSSDVVDSVKYPGCEICCSKNSTGWDDTTECCCNGGRCDDNQLESCKKGSDGFA